MKTDTFTAGWLATIEAILSSGNTIAPRGEKTYELLSHQLIFPMNNARLYCNQRRLASQFMWREAWWILTGRSDLETLEEVCPPMVNFSDDGIFMNGAYGPKVVDQLPWAIRQLVTDHTSRQVYINLWREKPGPSKDIPCTTGYQWMIREKKLHVLINMRSSDIWLGLPYDVWAVTMLSTYIAMALETQLTIGLELGNIYHVAGSRHLYASNVEKAARCISPNIILDSSEEARQAPKINIAELLQHYRTPHRIYHEFCNDLYRVSCNEPPLNGPRRWMK